MLRAVVVSTTLLACGSAQVTSSPERDPVAAVFGAEEWRVPGSLEHIGFHGDDVIVTTAGGSVVAFDRTGRRRVVAEGLLPWTSGVAFLDAQSLLLAGDKPVVVDVRTGKTTPFTAVAARRVASDGTRAVVGGEEGTPLTVFDLASRKPGIALEHSRHYASPEIVGTWVVAGRSQQTVGIWDLATGKRHRIFALGNTSIYGLSPDHALLAVGTFSGKHDHWEVDVYRVDDGKTLASVPFSCNPGALAINAASDRLAIACEEEVRVVALPGGEPVTTLRGSQAYVRTLAWSPRGDLLALGGNDNVLHLWRTSDWKPLAEIEGTRGEVRELDVAGRMLVSHSFGDGSAWIWSTETARPIIELGGPARDVLATATNDEVTLVALTLRPRDKTVLERWHGATRIDHVALSADRTGLGLLVRELGPVAGGGVWYTASGQLFVLDETLKQRWATEAPAEDLTSDAHASATPDGRRVAMYGSRKLTIADAIERRVVVEAPYECGGKGPAISPDGARVAFIDERGITVLDATTGKPVASLAFPHEATQDRAIAWNGRDVVTAIADGKLVAWSPGASSADVMPAPNTTSLVFAGDHIYLGRTDGTVARHSFSTLRRSARALPAAPVAACTPSGGMFGALGGFGSNKRGRLPDTGDYDADEVESDSPFDVTPSDDAEP
ncbi:MAG: hypothetical protein SFX73_00595 [Kofleriaceae bacterium]|nr:hypothetical protein [Kofleriaceae bacterium]